MRNLFAVSMTCAAMGFAACQSHRHRAPKLTSVAEFHFPLGHAVHLAVSQPFE